MTTARASRDIADGIDRTLLEQARKNELKVAYVRVLALGLSCFVNLAAYLKPDDLGVETYPLRNFALSALFTALAVGVVFLLRRHYAPNFRIIFPVADGVMVAFLFGTTTQSFEPEYLVKSGILVNIVAVCGLLAASGGLRLARQSAIITTTSAVLIFGAAATLADFSAIRMAFPLSMLLGAGLLSAWMTGIVRQSIQSEVARSILTRFLPARVVERAHDDPLQLITEPRSLDATVVVTDLRGFTALAEHMSPSELLDFLNEIQGRLAEIVHRHGGTIDKFMGDGMLAVFGAPEPQDDHAARALLAVTEIIRAVEDASFQDRVRVRLGVGVHSGELIAGCLGSGTKLEFTVLGDTVNATSRLEGMTKELGVVALISAETLARAKGEVPPELDLRPMGDLTLRGRSEAVQVHGVARDDDPVVSGQVIAARAR